jgi:hypothetical protein
MRHKEESNRFAHGSEGGAHPRLCSLALCFVLRVR